MPARSNGGILGIWAAAFGAGVYPQKTVEPGVFAQQPMVAGAQGANDTVGEDDDADDEDEAGAGCVCAAGAGSAWCERRVCSDRRSFSQWPVFPSPLTVTHCNDGREDGQRPLTSGDCPSMLWKHPRIFVLVAGSRRVYGHFVRLPRKRAPG